MLVECLWSRRVADESELLSFATITYELPAGVAAVGYDLWIVPIA